MFEGVFVMLSSKTVNLFTYIALNKLKCNISVLLILLMVAVIVSRRVFKVVTKILTGLVLG
jgi:hypothetical protein